MASYITLGLRTEIHRKLKVNASLQGKTLQQYLNDLIPEVKK